MAEAAEGVIKFHAEHAEERLEPRRFLDVVAELAAWREVLAALDLVGQDAKRYEGAGYGNVSARVGPFPGERGRRPFLISGTQTGGLACVSLDDFCLVETWQAHANRVTSRGARLPSSESLTHAALYDLSPHIRVVLHVHAPTLFARRRTLSLPTTDLRVPYGTPAMADEVARLYRESTLPERRVLAMGGHEDGVLSFGKSCRDAAEPLIAAHAAARALDLVDEGRLCRPRATP